MKINQTQEAINCFLEGLRIDPEYCPIYEELCDFEYD